MNKKEAKRILRNAMKWYDRGMPTQQYRNPRWYNEAKSALKKEKKS